VSEILTFPQFQNYLGEELELDPATLRAEATLREELDFDSVRLYELLIAVEDLGVEFPEELFEHILTIDDAYHFYVTKSQHGD
jgi:acyl carrier protein